MTVRELQQCLSAFDPEALVGYVDHEFSDTIEATEIKLVIKTYEDGKKLSTPKIFAELA